MKEMREFSILCCSRYNKDDFVWVFSRVCGQSLGRERKSLWDELKAMGRSWHVGR